MGETGDQNHDEFDEFDVDMSDLREPPAMPAGSAAKTIWVNELRRIAQEQIDSEPEEMQRLQRMRQC